MTIRRHDHALEKFCETKIGLYHQSFKESVESSDWHKIKCISNHLAQDSELLGAVKLTELVAKLLNALKCPACNEKQVRRKVESIMKVLETLKNDYKDYLDTFYTCKKVSILSTLTTVLHVEPTVVDDHDFNIDEEFKNQWKCVVQ